MTAWAVQEENVSNVLATMDNIEWGVDLVIMHLKGHNPHPKMTDLIDSIRGVGSNILPFYSCDHYFMPVKDAFNIQIRYSTYMFISIRLQVFLYFDLENKMASTFEVWNVVTLNKSTIIGNII